MAIHVLAHLGRLPRILLGSGDQSAFQLPGGVARWLTVAVSLAGGLIIALLAVHLAGPWEAVRAGHAVKVNHSGGFGQ